MERDYQTQPSQWLSIGFAQSQVHSAYFCKSWSADLEIKKKCTTPYYFMTKLSQRNAGAVWLGIVSNFRIWIFEIGIVYKLKMILILNLQMFESNFDIILEFPGSRQPLRRYSLYTFDKSSQSYKRICFRRLSINFKK